MYVDKETGKTLYQLHCNRGGKGIPKPESWKMTLRGTKEILEGHHPNYGTKKLKRRLIRDGLKAEACESCGFSERRLTDYTVPLILVWKDGNKFNTALDNIELLCYNCYYLTCVNLFEKRDRVADNTSFDGY
jgi:hypothetical protein